MWKLLTVAALLGLGLTAGSTIASAQGTINLNGSASTLTFTGDGILSPNTISLTLGAPCPTSSFCGANQTGGPSGFYDVTGSPSITLTSLGSGTWSVVQSAPLTFCFSSGADCTGTIYLKGNLQLESLLQGGTIGGFNYLGQANLTGLTGTLAATFTTNGVGYLNIGFTSPTNLALLLGTTNHDGGVKFSGGLIDPTPEPSSMLLFGSGLLAVGVLLRRRLLT